MQITDLVYIDDTGFHFADYPTFLQYVKDQMTAIYGADVYLEADAQDGQWVAVLAQMAYDTAALCASVYNSFSPATAQGVGLSRNVKINGITRRTATHSIATVTIVGQAATVITGGVVQDTLEQKWDLPAVVTIPSGGSIDVVATAQELGALGADAATITKIFTPTLGWQTVTNAAAATPGVPVETDAELRIRQARSTALPSLTVFDGTVGAVSNLPGVTKVRGYENDTGTTDGNGIPPHSICVMVTGGDSTDIANAIARHKTPGTGTFGSSSETVFDAHGMPLLIHWQAPYARAIKAEITIVANDSWSNDYIVLMQNAVAAAINATQIGGVVYITKLFSPAYLGGTVAADSFDIVTLQIARVGNALGDINIPLNFDEQAVCNGPVNIVVNVT